MTENPDDKLGDPIYVGHLVLATMLKGIKGELIQRETTTISDKGSESTTIVYEARLGWARLLFKLIQEGKDVKGGGSCSWPNSPAAAPAPGPGSQTAPP